MKAIFIHDHPFHSFENKFYSPATFPANIWERYLKVFDKLIVVGRGRFAKEVQGLSLSSHDNVIFKPFYNVSGGKDYLLKKRKIKQYLKSLIEESDAVILRLPSFFGSCAVEVCQELRVPYTAEVVGCAWDSSWNHGSLLGKVRASFSFFKTKSAIRDASAVIYVTEHFLQKRYPSNAKIVSFASNVFIENFPIEVLNTHQQLLMKDKESYNVGMIANTQVKYKGFDVLLKALQLIKRKLDKDFNLYLIGGGEPSYVNGLIEKYGLKGNVEVVGLVNSGDEVYSYLDNLDMYLQPSLTEGLPRAVIEAMSRACPVLASSVGGIPELLENEYLHKPGDYQTLSKQLVNFLHDKDALLHMSEQNFYKSKEYTAPVLNERRTAFWKKAHGYFLTVRN